MSHDVLYTKACKQVVSAHCVWRLTYLTSQWVINFHSFCGFFMGWPTKDINLCISHCDSLSVFMWGLDPVWKFMDCAQNLLQQSIVVKVFIGHKQLEFDLNWVEFKYKLIKVWFESLMISLRLNSFKLIENIVRDY